MRHIIAAIVFFVSTTLYSLPKEYYLSLGKCVLPLNPLKEQDQIQESSFTCVKGSAHLDGLFIPNKTFGSFDRFNLRGSTHLGNTHAIFFDAYFEQMHRIQGDELGTSRAHEIDTLAYQLGNPSYSKFRIVVGQQRPAFGINHYPSVGFNQLLEPRFIWGLPHPGVNVVYDTQNENQFELGWMSAEKLERNEKPKDHLFTARFSRDFALAGSTRGQFSFMMKKTGEKRFSLGFVSIGPKQNRFQAEWVRIYTSLGNFSSITSGTLTGSSEQSLNSGYVQLIRFAYEDPPDQKIRTSVLYDDINLTYRLFIIGFTFKLPIHSLLRFSLGFKQDVTEKKRHRWLIGTGIGFQL